jgi:hypothetical protein
MNISETFVPEQTPGLPAVTTLSHLLHHGCIPGWQGVVLEQKSVVFSDLWRLSQRIGVEVSLTKDLEQGNTVFRLRSGSRKRSPFTKPKFGLVRIIAHTHPSGASQRLPSIQDIENLNDLFLHRIRQQVDAELPYSRIIFGGGLHDYTIFWPTVLR